MNWLKNIERKMGRCYIPQLMKYLCVAMLGVFILDHVPMIRSASELLCFNKSLIMKGQIWRLVTFVFLPPSGNYFWILLHLYFYFFIGSALESAWGSRKFNLYYLIGILACDVGGMIAGCATNQYLNLSLMLAYAMLYPEVEFMLLFVLPVKAKWIGLAWCVYLLYLLIVVSWAWKIALVFSLLPLLLFQGRDVYLQGKLWLRHVRFWFNTRQRK